MSEPALILYLQGIARRNDRGALAALRRGLGRNDGAAPEVFPHVAPYVPSGDNREGRDWPYYLTATLFALHPKAGAQGDLGWTCRQLGAHDSAVKRFQALLASDPSQLPARLRQVVSLAAAHKHGVPIDWARLLRHLRHWDHPDGWVQRQWARSYWGARPAIASEAKPGHNQSHSTIVTEE